MAIIIRSYRAYDGHNVYVNSGKEYQVLHFRNEPSAAELADRVATFEESVLGNVIADMRLTEEEPSNVRFDCV